MTCQLCGKPLPKIWLRRDGEFCCREHREQYLLRRGLNCIQEADELAALRRRRERPVAMALQRPACPPSSVKRHAASASYPGSTHSPEERFAPSLPLASVLQLPAAGKLAEEPRGRGEAASYGRRGEGSLRGLAPRLVLEPVGAAARTAFLQACLPGTRGFRSPFQPAACAAVTRRSSQWQPARREARMPARHAAPHAGLHIGQSRSLLAAARATPLPATRYGAADLKFRPVAPALPAPKTPVFAVHTRPAQFAGARAATASRPAARSVPEELARSAGSPVRFSGIASHVAHSLAHCRLSAGPHKGVTARQGLGAPARRGFGTMPFAARQEALALRGLRAPRRPSRLPVSNALRAVAPGAPAPGGGRRSTCSLHWTLPAVAQPGSPAPLRPEKHRTALPAAVAPPPRSALNAMRPRTAALRALSARRPCPPQLPALFAGQARLNSPTYRQTAAAATDEGAAPRTAHVAAPRHGPLFSPNPLKLQGTFMGTIEDAGTHVRLEENFADGLSRWAGDVESWRLDAAGVRIRGLALFGPSLGMQDCQLQFLAKVESGGMGWVVRAADLANYYHVRMRLAGTAANPAWELVRHPVIAGTAGEAVTATLDATIRTRTSFQVQMNVAGPDFSVAVDGREVARWSETRLAAGGVGFLAGAEDRARLYWVKVASGSLE